METSEAFLQVQFHGWGNFRELLEVGEQISSSQHLPLSDVET